MAGHVLLPAACCLTHTPCHGSIWMRVNDRLDWSIGCKVVQHQINSKKHKALNTSPWQALTGLVPSRGFKLPANPVAQEAIVSEAQLQRWVAQQHLDFHCLVLGAGT